MTSELQPGQIWVRAIKTMVFANGVGVKVQDIDGELVGLVVDAADVVVPAAAAPAGDEEDDYEDLLRRLTQVETERDAWKARAAAASAGDGERCSCGKRWDDPTHGDPEDTAMGALNPTGYVSDEDEIAAGGAAAPVTEGGAR